MYYERSHSAGRLALIILAIAAVGFLFCFGLNSGANSRRDRVHETAGVPQMTRTEQSQTVRIMVPDSTFNYLLDRSA